MKMKKKSFRIMVLFWVNDEYIRGYLFFLEEGMRSEEWAEKKVDALL